MPRGILIVLIVNLTLSAIFAGNLVVFYAEGVTRTLVFIASWAALAGLLAVVFGIMMRGALWLRLSRTALYTVALVFGVQIMGTVPRIMELEFALSAAVLVLGVLYVVGARGYLNSPPARDWFGVAPAPDTQGD